MRPQRNSLSNVYIVGIIKVEQNIEDPSTPSNEYVLDTVDGRYRRDTSFKRLIRDT